MKAHLRTEGWPGKSTILPRIFCASFASGAAHEKEATFSFIEVTVWGNCSCVVYVETDTAIVPDKRTRFSHCRKGPGEESCLHGSSALSFLSSSRRLELR